MALIPKGLDGIELHFVDSVEEAGNFLRWLGERREHNAIAVDIETGEYPGRHKDGALSPWEGKIRLVQVGDGHHGWSLPWEEWSGVFYQGMSRYKGPIIFHNIAFEGKWFELQSRWDLPWEQAHDTMLMAQINNPGGRAALKVLAQDMVDFQAANLQSGLNAGMSDNGWTWGTVPVTFQPYWAYGALDTILTARIFDIFWDDFAPGKRYSKPYEIEMATRRIANRMEINGARVDLDYSQRKLDQLTQFTDKSKAWARSNYNGLSITSTVQLIRAFEGMGVELTETTASGQKKMTKDTLKLLSIEGNDEVKTLANLVLQQRKADKLASSYFSNFIEKSIDGVLHPQIKTMAARTGRMSIIDPALQTLPSGDATVRHAFIPQHEGHGIMASDLDQVEFRLTASLSGDQPLLSVFKEADATGGDVFTTIMRQVYNDNSLEKSDARRKLIKGVVYGKLYGAGVDKMALTAGVSKSQMQGVVSGFDNNYPGVKDFQKRIEEQGMRRLKDEGVGYVETSTGRRLPCDSDRVYSLTNYLIQASAAEIFKQNLIKLDNAGLTEYMVVPVHDEIVLDIPKADASEIIAEVRDCMTTTEGWPIPLSADAEGPYDNWGDKYQHQ